MSYHSFKRVLGETSLERKCRLLFGACLLLLISLAFWWAEMNAERLVREVPRLTGEYFVAMALMGFHAERLHNVEPLEVKATETLNRDSRSVDFAWEFLALDAKGIKKGDFPQEDSVDVKSRLARGEEVEILERLEQALNERLDRFGRPLTLDERRSVILDTQSAIPVDGGTAATGAANPVSEAGSDATVGELDADLLPKPTAFDEPLWTIENADTDYHYYQVVFWTSNCTICHIEAKDVYAYAPEQWNQMTYDGQPRPNMLRVMKVAIPAKPTRRKIQETRAILGAIAIGTVFLSMIALYAVVRYVIVKPLNHLRDISDEISRGNYDLRASIRTRDEFEDLADSFNRMLRHLVDAHGELRSVNEDLDAKVDQLAQANMQLHEMNRVKSDFLANMSHELRTPLNSIIGFADVLKDNESLSGKQRRYAENIATSGRSLLDMINDILDLAKMESGKMEVRLSEFSIEPLVSNQCDLLRTLSEEKNIDLATSIQPDLPPLYQDQGKIQQILMNLLSNAIKFTPEGGRITVSAARDPMRFLVLTVADTGVGIAEEDREIIFEKFRQGNAVLGRSNLTREFSGTGLGLSIVKELSKLLGGEITFASELGKGSSFTVRVPWTLAERPKLDSSLSQRLLEVTKPPRRLSAPASFSVISAPIDESNPSG